MNYNINFNKYETYIRVGHNGFQNEDGTYTCTDLQPFPTPTTLSTSLHDLDKDPFTDLAGFTHRNRVRHDVLDLEISYDLLSDDDISYILNRISPEWIYIELIDKKTKTKKVHKMYASDKQFDTFKAWIDENDNWHELKSAFTVSFVEE